MIIYSKEEGLIKPCGIKKLDGTRDFNYKLPHIAVGVFSEEMKAQAIIIYQNQKK